MGFPRQAYWSRLTFPSTGDLADPGIKPVSPAWQVDSLPLSHLRSPYLHMRVRAHTHTRIDIDIVFQILFSYRLLQNTEYGSLCCTVGPCWLLYFPVSQDLLFFYWNPLAHIFLFTYHSHSSWSTTSDAYLAHPAIRNVILCIWTAVALARFVWNHNPFAQQASECPRVWQISWWWL